MKPIVEGNGFIRNLKASCRDHRIAVPIWQNPYKQLVPMLKILGQKDKMNEYTKTVASALFAIPGGCAQGQYIVQALFES